MLKDIIENGLINNPWPVFFDEKIIPGSKFDLDENCSASCIYKAIKEKNMSCAHGYSFFKKEVAHLEFYILGRRNVIKGNRKQKVALDTVNKWFNLEAKKIQAVIEIANLESKKQFERFHELSKWVKTIEHHAEKLVFSREKKHGVGLVENLPNDLKKIYKSTVLLVDSLESSEIYFNPESARFGKKKQTDVYRLVDKLTKILDMDVSKSSKFQIQGHVDKQYYTYESFKIILLSIMQNAQKYNKENHISVRFDEGENELFVDVISRGVFLGKNDIDKIFKRGYRSSKIKHSNKGSGLGLYIAKIVADAHGFPINVTSNLLENHKKGLAENIFRICIH